MIQSDKSIPKSIEKKVGKDRKISSSKRREKGPFDRRTRRNSSYDCLDERSCDWTRNSDGDVRLRKLEALVDRLIRRESHSSENSQHVVRMAVKSDCIPEFLPGKPNQSSVKWVDKIDQLARVNKWDENTTIQLMQNRLTGLARTWYDHLTTYTHTWDEWKALLVKTFPDHHDFAATLRQLLNREKQFHESMTQYYFGKMNLLQACNITGKHAVSCLIDGLSDRTLRNGAKAGCYETPEELYTEYLSTLVAEVADNETKVANRRGKGFDRRRLGTKMSPSTNKRNDSDSTEKRILRCYNCHESGHVAGKCPKPRVECGNCKLLGHEAGKCRRHKTSGPSVRLLCPSDTQDCYFVGCAINGKPLKGYIDTGCSIVTLRKTTTIELQFEQRPSTQLIRGYAGGVTPALGEAEVTLTVDLITAKVTASIVEDRVQSVPVIIGQTILNRAGVTMVLRDNQIRLFDKHLAALPGLDDLPSRKVALRSKEDVVIPSHMIGFIEDYSPETYDGDVYVEATTSNSRTTSHELNMEGIQPGRAKTKAVSEYPRPTNVHEIRQFIGLTSYFRRFIKNFATKAKPLTKLTKANMLFIWGEEQEEAFRFLKQRLLLLLLLLFGMLVNRLYTQTKTNSKQRYTMQQLKKRLWTVDKKRLVERPVLALYNRDAHTELHTDASKHGIGGILLQRQQDQTLRPICYFSRQTSKVEEKYHSYELETLAVVDPMRRFRIYLLGIHFTVVTDCNAIRTTMTKRDLIPRVGRWWLLTQEYDFSVEYRAGQKMAHVDALSRNSLQKEINDHENEFYVHHMSINEDDWVLAAQLTDELCKHIHAVLSRQPEDNEDKRIHSEYVLKQNRIFKVTPTGERWVVPKTARSQIVFFHHDNVGHFGAEKTLELIKGKYWFPKMKKYVKRYVSCCLACMYNKEPTGKQPGPCVTSARKNTHLILAIDGFTKFAFLKAVRNTSVGPVLTYLDEIFSMFGVAQRIVCDRGSCFTSKRFISYCQTLNIKVNHNATATPRANGQAERYNRTILSCLAASTDDERKWDETLRTIQWGLNTTVNKTTGKTPYELLLGYQPRQANDAFLSTEVCEVTRDDDLPATRIKIGKRISAKQAQQKTHYDKKRRAAPTYTVGQHVLIRKVIPTNDGKSKKLLQHYSGPYEITKVLDSDRFVVRDLSGSTRSQRRYEGVVSIDKMKPYDLNSETDTDDTKRA
uniref:RNA-directed DNA polymerase n=1 Tax=Tenebrio molitor TaxID=7067 RepID=A0A8J6H5I7_TENMO|nr:hypothetical protein GEV33_015113 [Tenebrio molitor]